MTFCTWVCSSLTVIFLPISFAILFRDIFSINYLNLLQILRAVLDEITVLYLNACLKEPEYSL
jgi:hypothetical protein